METKLRGVSEIVRYLDCVDVCGTGVVVRTCSPGSTAVAIFFLPSVARTMHTGVSYC